MNTNDTPPENKAPRSRRQHDAEEKVRLLRLHLVEGQAISKICEEHGIHPTLFYQWQKTFFENGAAAFERTGHPRGPDVKAVKSSNWKRNSSTRTGSSRR